VDNLADPALLDPADVRSWLDEPAGLPEVR